METEATLARQLEIIRAFVQRVNYRAEQKMAHTGKLEGSHYAAMRQEIMMLERRVAEVTL